MVFTTIICSGVPNTISKYTPMESKANQNKLVTAGFIISTITSIFCILFIIFFKNFFISIFAEKNGYDLLLIMIPAIISTGLYTSIRGNFWGNEMFFQASLVEFIEQVIRVILFFTLCLFFSNNNSILFPGISISVACVCSTILGLFIYKKNKGKFSNPKGYFKPIIKSSAPITLVRICGSVVQPLIAIILPLRLTEYGITNETALSELGVTMGMTLPLLSIPFTLIGALTMALIPNVSTLKKNKEYSELNKQINSSFIFSLIVIFSIIPAFISLGKEICEVIYDNSQAGEYLIKATWLMIPMGLSQVSSTILNAMGYESKSMIYYAIGSIFLFICIWFLPKYFGILCVIAGLGSSSIISSILNLIHINKITKIKKYYFKEILFYTLLSIPCVILTKSIYKIFIVILSKFFAVILSCVISFIAIITLFVAFKVIDYEIILSKIKNKFKKNKLLSIKKKVRTK